MSNNPACVEHVERMLKNSQTKVIVPVLTLGLVQNYVATNNDVIKDSDIRKCYEKAVKFLAVFLGHDVHIGAKYYDAYGGRMSRYAVLAPIEHLKYRLLPPYTNEAEFLCGWLPTRIKQHIDEKLGIVPYLGDVAKRTSLSEDASSFMELIRFQINRTSANFEIFSFAVLKVHLEKFACKIYRDTRTTARDGGVDLSTNFGVVYQVKKLRINTQAEAERIYAELRLNFDTERLQDGNVILVIDDVSKEIKKYLIDMKVQSLSKEEVLKLACNFDNPEDRQKVLRIVYEEFRREYSSRIS